MMRTMEQANEQLDQTHNQTARTENALATRAALEHVPVDVKTGMISYSSFAEVAYAGELYAKGGVMLPAHLQGSPGACALTLTQAIKWRLDFMFVASQQYVQNGRVNYMSQIFKAILENSNMLEGRMRHSYSGEGMERRCKVWATFRGEKEPHEYESPPLKDLLPPKNDSGQYKGSPLWKRKPDLQMLYDTQRDWVRMYAPDIFGGIYDPTEFDENEHAMAPRNAAPVASTATGLAERLKENKRKTTSRSSKRAKGFDEGHVNGTLDQMNGDGAKTISGEATVIENDDPPKTIVDEPGTEAAIEAARVLGAKCGAEKAPVPAEVLAWREDRQAEWDAFQAAYVDAYPSTTEKSDDDHK